MFSYRTKFNVTHDNKFVIDQFGGSLNKNYSLIQLSFVRNEFRTIMIKSDKCSKDFNPKAFNYTNKNLDEFFKVRKNKSMLTKLRITVTLDELLNIDWVINFNIFI